MEHNQLPPIYPVSYIKVAKARIKYFFEILVLPGFQSIILAGYTNPKANVNGIDFSWRCTEKLTFQTTI